ncbi:MAG TPA: enoyl-CoA hydratase/isomerase family protein [Trebonia sp.]|jgi:enoyl-CoA hydratase/carnithine racemase|nr:enoyl-CoA hydratase/isomerase family protein [Trebonia sp.]
MTGVMETIALEARGPVTVLTLNRPRVRNAIDDQLRSELRGAVDQLAADTSVRGVVLTGAGSAFCAGGDIRGMQERLDQGARAGELGWRRQRELHETLEKLYQLDRPTVAAVNGAATGLGLDLALNCDFVFLANSATVASSFVKRGLVPDGGGMFHLPRRVGLSKAKELVFSGRDVAAEEALRIGLADRVIEAGQLLDEAVSWLSELTGRPGLPQGLAKSVINHSYESSLAEINALGSQAQAMCYASAEHQESVREFLAAREAARASKAGQSG